MVQSLNYLRETPSQTVGPYVHIGCMPNYAGITGVYPEDLGWTMVNEQTQGERITLTGRIFDGSGAVLRDAMVEIWQADAQGLYNSPVETRGKADPNFTGWGRRPTLDSDGSYTFETIKPGPVPFPDGRLQAPHICVWITARGINLGLMTRVYFPEEERANAADPILSRIELKHRVPTLIAKRQGSVLTFDIRLQGEGETIFFES